MTQCQSANGARRISTTPKDPIILKNHQPLGGTNHQRSMTCSSWVGELVVVDYVFVPELVPMRIGRTRPTRCSKLLQCRYQPISFGCTPSLPRSLPLRGTQDPEGSVREAAPRRQGLTPPVVPSNVEKPGSMEVCSWEN